MHSISYQAFQGGCWPARLIIEIHWLGAMAPEWHFKQPKTLQMSENRARRDTSNRHAFL